MLSLPLFMSTLRRLARVPAFLFALIFAMLPLAAFAQDAAPAPPTSFLGSVYVWIVGAVGSAIVALSIALGVFLRARGKDSAAWSLVNRLWVIMQSAVAHAEAELRPLFAKALEDGKLTPDEGAQLKKRTLEIFKSEAAELVRQIPAVLGLSADGVGTFLSGLLERAVSGLKPSPASAPPATIANLPPAVAAVLKAAGVKAEAKAPAPKTEPPASP